ncbi:hypothetical protein SPICUR_04430 [Spiribacter curvatus]|uniref:Uncharacterized protein n=1 Tax=Spiribacter curvatus TaxID=1335757 RepID=U5T345_9GAMM|nr:hypothetical protein SPICUR_04430 [Spiribacter curvatus]
MTAQEKDSPLLWRSISRSTMKWLIYHIHPTGLIVITLCSLIVSRRCYSMVHTIGRS